LPSDEDGLKSSQSGSSSPAPLEVPSNREKATAAGLRVERGLRGGPRHGGWVGGGSSGAIRLKHDWYEGGYESSPIGYVLYSQPLYYRAVMCYARFESNLLSSLFVTREPHPRPFVLASASHHVADGMGNSRWGWER
jgi:hypothetical protein